MNVRSILLLVMIDTSWSTYFICPDPYNSGGSTHFPHPNNCAKFIKCNWGQPTEHDCPVGTLWNDFVKTCDHARNVKCRTRQQQNTIVPNCPRVVEIHRPVYASHQDCSKFHLCTPIGPQEMLCSPGSNWNRVSNRCEWSGSTNAVSSHTPRTTTTVLTTSSTPSTTTPAMLTMNCPSEIDPTKPVFIPHSECSRFYVCTLRGPMELNCKEGYHWSIRANRCELPWDAGCIDVNESPSSTTTLRPSTVQTTTRPTSKTCPDHVDPNKQVFLQHPDSAKIYNPKNGCLLVGVSSNVSPSSGVTHVNQFTTTDSNTANGMDATMEPDEVFITDVPIF